ncbi:MULTISPECIES: hypothetical protein, partial [unclassified Mesorhizobium]|uniref:hypothetical protein n=1 Tax=unclassified Mesorhizobium TaxID=325217 RepID=UPI001AEF0791
INTSRKAKSVTHVSGTFRHLCLGSFNARATPGPSRFNYRFRAQFRENRSSRFPGMASEPDPDAPAPAADTTAAAAPIATADPAPDAATPTASIGTMPPAMRDLLHLGLIVSFEDGRIRPVEVVLVELVKDSVAVRDPGNCSAGSGQACKSNCSRDAKHSSKKQPTFHQNLPSCLPSAYRSPAQNEPQRERRLAFERTYLVFVPVTRLRAG